MITNGYPLQWPLGRNRTSSYEREWGNLNKMPAGRIRQLLNDELRKMGVTDYVVSCNVELRADGLPYANQKAPDDPGVALYFTRKGKDIVITCDRWQHIDSNLRAIGLTIEAIRGMERWGTDEMVDRTFTGFAELPESIIMGERVSELWNDVLQVAPNADYEIVQAAYKRMLHKAHPDTGGSDFEFQKVQNAWKQYNGLKG